MTVCKPLTLTLFVHANRGSPAPLSAINSYGRVASASEGIHRLRHTQIAELIPPLVLIFHDYSITFEIDPGGSDL